MAMTPTPDRDAALDRILQRFAIPSDPAVEDVSVTEDCLDPEIIAAMADGGLSPDEQTVAAEHALTCARCREVIAAVIRTTPEPAPRRAWWQLPAMRWLAPAVAAGLAVVVWVAVVNRYPGVTTVSVPVQTPERREQAAAPGPEAGQAKADSNAVQTAQRDAKTGPPVAQPAPVEAAKDPAASGGRTFRADALDAPQTALQKQRAKAAELTDRVAAAKPAKEEASEKKSAALAPVPLLPASAPSPASSPAPPPATSTVMAGAAGRGVREGQESPRPPERFADRAAASPLAEAASIAVPDITSPDARSRWRISGTSVERSTDGGETWIAQRVPIAVRLLAGSSPGPDTCWIVGDQGTIMVSTDGRSWALLNAPDLSSFVSVRATSADVAAVTTSDGRTFATANRGRTWTRQ
jgi:hypothetical protein